MSMLKDKHGQTALTLAAYEGHVEVVKALLAHSEIDVNAKIENGATALMLAAWEGREDVVNALLAHSKIDVNAEGNYG